MKATKKILIVEDELSQQSALVSKLDKPGIEIYRAMNGEEGYLLAQEHQPNLILLDIMMPKLDGISTLRKIQEQPWGQHIPVIVLTNYDNKDFINETLPHDRYEYTLVQKTETSLQEISNLVDQQLGHTPDTSANADHTVMIVEDEPSLQNALHAKLERAGFNVMVANDGQVALDLATESHPELILLDLSMPVMNGREFLQQLRSSEWGKKTKVIILSNSSEPERVADALSDNVFEYFVKADTPLEKISARVQEFFDEQSH